MNLKYLSIAFLVVSFLGFLDAAYLTTLHYLAAPVPCSITEGCEEVLTSSYATMGGIPVALVGSFYYLAIFFVALSALSSEKYGQLRYAAFLGIVGLTASLFFVYLQIYVIKALCIYCLVSAFMSFLLSMFGAAYLLKKPYDYE